MQNRIPCTFMRAGTSRGAFLDLRDLPSNHVQRDIILLKVMGSPDKRQIDGLGGASFVTSKVVMAQPSQRKHVDIDFLFAQVVMDKPIVDTKPTCYNMMAGVGPFAIEKGWVKASDPETRVMVYNINTDSKIEIIVQTPNKQVNYSQGNLHIDGVPGTAAPIQMNLHEIGGGATGHLFPSQKRKEIINGIEVSIVDAGNMMVLIKAEDLGLSGLEGKAFFEKEKQLMARIEAIRLEAGIRSSLGDVSKSVIPKVGLLSSPRIGGTIKSQYLTPRYLHPTHAVSGAVCISTACKAQGTVAAEIANVNNNFYEKIIIEHPSGIIPVNIEVQGKGGSFTVIKAGTLRTARKIMDGYVYY